MARILELPGTTNPYWINSINDIEYPALNRSIAPPPSPKEPSISKKVSFNNPSFSLFLLILINLI